MGDRYEFLNTETAEWEEIICSLPDIEKKWSAPFYLFHENRMMWNLELLRRCLGGASIAYAAKANPWLIRAAVKRADYIEVCTEGELELCQAYEIPGAKIVMDGVLRTEKALQQALNLGVKRFCVDSSSQLEQLIHMSGEIEHLEILLRVSSGNQFGMDKKEVEICIRLCSAFGKECITGVQFYPGTQRNEKEKVKRDIDVFRQWLEWLEKLQDFQAKEIQFGSGIGFPYFLGDRLEDYKEALDEIAVFIRELSGRYRVIYEVGRLVAASCGLYVTKVFGVKEREDKRILFCLGGINHFQYPGGAFGIREPGVKVICASPAGRMRESMVCGALCSEADVWIRRKMLDEGIRQGDLLAFPGAGAYCAVEAPNLLLAMEMPAVLVYNKSNSANIQDIDCAHAHIPTYRLVDDRA